ncbi:MAG: hypothetical protein M1834_007618 [Cirrosporium novae-zelandiae]|nr:MAG: hypothetical protein M1834_007618 [Cirrosporium novae-zelandiae]
MDSIYWQSPNITRAFQPASKLLTSLNSNKMFIEGLPLEFRLSWPRALLGLVVSFFLFQIIRGIYRITLHPLAKFPGPKLTAMTRWYEAYYEVVVGGQFGNQIEKWHKQYGPIVRVNPYEVHIIDPHYYDVLFNFDPHLEKREFAINNLVHTPSSAQHKMRRQVLQSFFSRAGVQRVEYMIHNGLAKLCRHYYDAKENQTPVRVSLLYRCLLADVICEYAFGISYNFLDNPIWSEGFFNSFKATFKHIFFFRESKLVNYISLVITQLPEWMFSRQNMKAMLEWSAALRKRIDASMKGEYRQEKSHKTIFEEYKNNKLPPAEKTNHRLFQVGLMIIGAGFGSASFALDTGHYHICANPEIYQRLKAELTEAWPDVDGPPPPVATLEKLPYLKACIQESLRLSLGTMGRLQRVNHHEVMRYGDWVIPKHTPIGMSHRFIHHNQDLFPNSQKYDPGRWLQGEKSKYLEKYLVTFSRGSRQCLAIHMAYAELFLALATVFRRFDMELYDTTRVNIDPKYDYFFPVPEETDERIRVLVK